MDQADTGLTFKVICDFIRPRRQVVRIFVLILVVAMLPGCGSGNSCEGVDTSQAPTSISHSSSSTTYYWGDCSRTYPNN
jgi:hypothetical protein